MDSVKSSSRRRKKKFLKAHVRKTPITTLKSQGNIDAPKQQNTSSQKPAQPSNTGPFETSTRIAKAIARAGLCSRREAERWIEKGRVSVNGRPLSTPAFDVTQKDVVCVDGFPLPSPSPPQLWCYHKPKGLVTTHDDPQGRPTVFQNLPPFLPRVISVGRLDFNTEGLLLLTNDGALARYLELPSTGWLRRYRVRAQGRVSKNDLERLHQGVKVEGVQYGSIEASIDSVQGANTWLTLGLREGKNREIKKILSSMGLKVSRLIRISFGPFELGNLIPGQVEDVPQRQLTQALGSQNARRLNVHEGSGFKNKERCKLSSEVRSKKKEDKE